MCYSVYFSTTSHEDFSNNRSQHFKILRPHLGADAEILELLAYPERWYLASKFGGCSCHFRHDPNRFGFGPVLDWSPEDADDVDSTKHVYDLLQLILSEGHEVDVLDVWDGTAGNDVRSVEVELGKAPRDHFRFLEGTHMLLSA